ncbi:hypothetical protein [Novosphingobium sp.]|uniref:hypothetical protein n=1 Tax=Novosphingobium sp. TaxID=1874826 RepID=UPI0035B39EB5
MANSPTTFRGEPADPSGTDWNHAASLHRRGDDGMLNAFRIIRQGTLAELVRFVASLPEAERANYEIAKEGGRRLNHVEIMGLATAPDLPGRT